ncbi:secreted RxLR effector protein 161-like isoform X2 [Gossypium raimondii]|uniref:secreted RxLR effector protein 161-like isoform X1 n=1 Tax=Gossypium raimondii TaxID=29730 RepID=UPI00227C2785|nr:secreted RxLR effector protein 161-like isoform X1 [Gossypium raimondii]XP_052484068.1 secreted RxLR effector protein 161-like isoform X2 [Gossypium raimondii]
MITTRHWTSKPILSRRELEDSGEDYLVEALILNESKSWNIGKISSNLGIDHWRAAKKFFRHLNGTKDYMFTYKRSDNLEVIGYSDSNFSDCVDSRKSTSSYIFMFVGFAIS